MLAGTTALGGAISNYHLCFNPMQVEVNRVVEDLTELGEKSVKWSTDGCNLPAPAVPLQNMAKLYAKFVAAADATELSDQQVAHMARVFNAMTNYPDMVAGDARFCTDLIETYRGVLIGKVEAGGCYGIGVRASEQTRRLGSSGAIGIAIKVEDGNLDILYFVAAEILARLQIGNEQTLRKLDRFRHLKRLNTAGIEVGNHYHTYRLRPCSAS